LIVLFHVIAAGVTAALVCVHQPGPVSKAAEDHGAPAFAFYANV
jgi:hypothetical protein